MNTVVEHVPSFVEELEPTLYWGFWSESKKCWDHCTMHDVPFAVAAFESAERALYLRDNWPGVTFDHPPYTLKNAPLAEFLGAARAESLRAVYILKGVWKYEEIPV